MTIVAQLALIWIGVGTVVLLSWCLLRSQRHVSVWEQRTSREDAQPWSQRNLD